MDNFNLCDLLHSSLRNYNAYFVMEHNNNFDNVCEFLKVGCVKYSNCLLFLKNFFKISQPQWKWTNLLQETWSTQHSNGTQVITTINSLG